MKRFEVQINWTECKIDDGYRTCCCPQNCFVQQNRGQFGLKPLCIECASWNRGTDETEGQLKRNRAFEVLFWTYLCHESILGVPLNISQCHSPLFGLWEIDNHTRSSTRQYIIFPSSSRDDLIIGQANIQLDSISLYISTDFGSQTRNINETIISDRRSPNGLRRHINKNKHTPPPHIDIKTNMEVQTLAHRADDKRTEPP